MSFAENDYSALNGIGNTPVTRNLMPTLRASVRRADPDGISAVAYYPATSGKTLRVSYTKEVSTVVTEFQEDIAFASNSFVAIIAAINAADPGHLEATDQDGFLVLRNRNTGKTHFLRIDPWTTPANDAAVVFGLAIDPFPGSSSFAGEIASTPGLRNESNAQGTTLIGRDEDLKADTFNRSLADLYHKLDTLRAELERDVLVFRRFDVTVAEHTESGNNVFYLDDATVRVPIFNHFDGEAYPAQYIRAMSGPSDNIDTGLNVLTVSELNYVDDDTTDFETGEDSFAAWGTPDGGAIWRADVPAKDKHPEIAITSAVGNVIFCNNATFEDLYVQKGDLVLIEDATKAPFDCSGWFSVLEVLGQEHISVRRLSPSERAPTDDPRPVQLSPSLTGTVTIPMGYAIPATENIAFTVSIPVGSYTFQIACLVPMREALADDWGRTDGTADALGDAVVSLQLALAAHLADPADAHAASAITGFTAATTWLDATTVTGATLRAVIEDIIGDLRSTTGTGGAHRIGSGAIDLGGVVTDLPYQLGSASVHSQIASLLAQIRGRTNYLQNAPWADGDNFADASVTDTLHSIITDLARFDINDDNSTDGARCIGVDYYEDADGNAQWDGGTLRSVIEHFANGGSVHAGSYFIRGLDFEVSGNSAGGSTGFENNFLTGGKICYDAQAPSELMVSLTKLVPLPATTQARSYFFSGGSISFVVEGGGTATCTCHLFRIDTDGGSPTIVHSYFISTVFSAGFHEESLDLATGAYLRIYGSPPADLCLFFEVSVGATSYVDVTGATIEIRYGDPTP